VPGSPTSPGQGRARPRTALINEKLVGQANIRAGDRLDAMPSFSAWPQGTESPAPAGQLLTFVDITEVTVRPPDRMHAEMVGDIESTVEKTGERPSSR
jgi:hypothetical protein